jgi:hypothetical protein
MLWLQTNKPVSGVINLGGSLTRQVLVNLCAALLTGRGSNFTLRGGVSCHVILTISFISTKGGSGLRAQ